MARSPRSSLLIAGNDLRRRLRNRSFLVQAFVGPIALALVISAAFSGGFGSEVKVGVVAEERSALAEGIRDALLEGAAEEVEFVAFDELRPARTALDDGDVGAVLVLPVGFERSLGTPAPRSLEVLTERQEVVAGTVAAAVARGVAARVHAGRLTVAALEASGEEGWSPEQLLGLDLPIRLDRRSAGEELTAASTVAPGMGLLFLFFTVAAVARALLDERRQRVLDRMLAAPVTITDVLLGKAMAVMVLGLTSLVTLWGATTVFFGADWGDPLGVLAILVAATFAVAGISAVVAGLARNEQSADLVATAVAFILGILGGSLVPLSELPDGLLRVSLFTPNGWAQRAFAELSAGGGDLRDVLAEVGVLLGWAAGAILLAALLLPRRLAAR